MDSFLSSQKEKNCSIIRRTWCLVFNCQDHSTVLRALRTGKSPGKDLFPKIISVCWSASGAMWELYQPLLPMSTPLDLHSRPHFRVSTSPSYGAFSLSWIPKSSMMNSRINSSLPFLAREPRGFVYPRLPVLFARSLLVTDGHRRFSIPCISGATSAGTIESVLLGHESI